LEEIKPTPTIEEYLETILNMTLEGKTVLAARLAERLEVAPPTVAATLRRMKRDGLISIGEHKEIALTERGQQLALTVVRRHRLVERLLTDVLGVDWSQAHDEACLIEHGISARVEEKLYQALDEPATCPHGSPIPKGDTFSALRGVPLDSAAEGERVTVERVSEVAERDPRLMEFLERSGIIPGASLTIKEVAPYAGTITVVKDRESVSLGLKAAAEIWVLRPQEHS
jgi:DtxR family Mn-dependent transcriptional regulator